MLWIGESLSPVERACMRSVMAHGHRLTLYTYDAVARVPQGVEVQDAARILPRDAIIRHRSGSVALFSDWFRFELMRLGKGIWLDADMYLLAPLTVNSDGHLFGFEDSGRLGAGVLSLPSDSPIIPPILRLFTEPYVPGWVRWQDRLRAHGRRLLRGRVELEKLPWGVAGPWALTALARKHRVIHLARPKEDFYPYGYKQADWIFTPGKAITDVISPETRAIHLYNFMISSRKNQPALPGSFLARLQEEGA